LISADLNFAGQPNFNIKPEIMKNKLMLLTVLSLLSSGIKAQEIGEKAPDFTFDVLDGGSFTLSEQSGKVVVIFCFGYSCPYCVTSGPYIQSGLVELYASDDRVVIIGVDIWNGPPSSVATFRSNTGLTIPLLMMAGSFGSNYVTAQDRLFVVDSEGTLIYRSNTPAGEDIDAVAGKVTEALGSITSIGTQPGDEFDLINFPNPASGEVNVRFSLSQPAHAEVRILSFRGDQVYLINSYFGEGENQISADISKFPPGVYFSELILEDGRVTRKLIVTR
jgi:peroxiredoxin